jgi:hypothetical protein
MVVVKCWNYGAGLEAEDLKKYSERDRNEEPSRFAT